MRIADDTTKVCEMLKFAAKRTRLLGRFVLAVFRLGFAREERRLTTVTGFASGCSGSGQHGDDSRVGAAQSRQATS